MILINLDSYLLTYLDYSILHFLYIVNSFNVLIFMIFMAQYRVYAKITCKTYIYMKIINRPTFGKNRLNYVIYFLFCQVKHIIT